MQTQKKLYFDWVDALKAFAILFILLNHLVEEFGPDPWFTNPSENWPDLSSRLEQVFPAGPNIVVRIFYFLGWLGDSGPGVFILLSGFGLTLSALRQKNTFSSRQFYAKRLLRIFPLYIAIHLLTLAGSLFVPGQEHSVASIESFLSLLGLRFTDDLFFYINPSWWFIWLILQLYVVFPLLFRLLNRWGVTWFFGATLAFTLASRGMGLLGFHYNESLFNWMTGIFFGTRLVEFSSGMVLGYLMVNRREEAAPFLKVSTVFPLALITYVIGLAASITWPGALVSNLLVTIGMSGLFYALWEGVIKKRLKLLVVPMLWIGVSSYGVYLLHQAPLLWARSFFHGVSHLAAALVVLALSFPIARVIEVMVDRSLRYYADLEVRQKLLAGSGMVALLVLAAPQLLEFAGLSGLLLQLAYLFITVLMILIILIEQKAPSQKLPLWRFLLLFAFFNTLFQLFILPPGFGLLSLGMGFLSALLLTIFNLMISDRAKAWLFGLSTIVALVILTETGLKSIHPLEPYSRWGEYPALEVHPTRTYALKPDLNIRLRYNNYDYRLKTNVYGLANPPVSEAKVPPDTYRILIIGDAFSMPEGLEYEAAYPALLQEHLQELPGSRPVEVINAGVTGYGPNEQLPQLSELLPQFRPDLVLYQFFINEFLEVQLTAEERLQDIGLISELSSPASCIRASQILIYTSTFQRKLKELITGNSDNAYRYEKSLITFYEKDDDFLYTQEALQKLRSALAAMKKQCAAAGSRLLISFVPGQVEISKPSDIDYFPEDVDLSDTTRFDLQQPLKFTRQIAGELDIPLFDLTPFLRESSPQPVYFPGSWHWNREGHKVAARAIFQELKDRKIFAPGN